MKIYISPMAGYTDYSYRKILKKFNPDLLFTEMINAHLLNKNDKITENELLKCDDKINEGVQIFGHDKENIVNAFLKAEKIGFKNLNLNMGCPQPKIIKKGAGSALLPKIELIDNLLYELKEKLDSKTKLSLKIRIGYRSFSSPELYIKIADKYGLDFICVHGRTGEQFYKGNSDWNIVSRLSYLPRSETLDFIGNGDLFEAEQIVNTITSSNLNGVMLSRGIIGNPWLVTQLKELLETGKISSFPDLNTIKNTVLKHIEYLIENKGKIIASLEINKFLKPYFKNFLSEDTNQKLKEIITKKDINKKIQSIINI
ncbi:tRNA-dihydrouridine synthase family protein [Leptotrichia sp. OH3620_COT-345]|uniref:tRNA dihydrouridine synthase n=1 Tax=Leptotrichia sp. OH3620_COT-345 TaxID=2491048 RepID=UPI000F653B88|nr:tRNA-dihydrouridine synthase family protein [Leptotrichia sp. OH3620_COT-345]RRD39771.1 tRNA-dihydrouridine synthase family protein [Leptotrichia sp. OH3620_COT-345]